MHIPPSFFIPLSLTLYVGTAIARGTGKDDLVNNSENGVG